MTVRSPKTEHHPGGESRLVPIFPELRPYLEEAWDQAEPGMEYVITRYRASGTAMGILLSRIIERAGLKPWPKLWQNLRATRATELVAAGWPEYKVCKWIGHTEAVAKKHYWQVTDDDYRKAAQQVPALQSALQSGGAKPCNAVNVDFQPSGGTLDIAPSCANSHDIAHNYTCVQNGIRGSQTNPRIGWA